MGKQHRQRDFLRDQFGAGSPPGVSYVWQAQGLETRAFGSVAMVGLTGEFSDVWQGKKLGDGGQGIEVKPEKGLRGRRG